MEDLPSTLTEARELNSQFYYTGKPCKHGHISKRRTYNSGCVECHLVAAKAYRESGRAKEVARSYYERIREDKWERIMLTSAKSRASNRNQVCTITTQDVRELWPADNKCPILGIPLIRNFGKSGVPTGHSMFSPSLDCIVPDKGYVPGNVIIMSVRANLIKNNETDPKVFRKIADWLENEIK